MKPNPWEWNEADLLDLVAMQVGESLTIEYKGCGALAITDPSKDEVSKDVSAFANSAGGTIVHGMLDDKHLPTGLDVGYDPRGKVNKDWLEQIINSRIQRRIDGARINPVILPSQADRVALVVHVPQSVRASHQAADKRFYRRFNFHSVPMEEYEVRDVSQRSASPDLAIKFTYRYGMPIGRASQSVGSVLGVAIENRSPTPVEYAIIDVLIDERLSPVSYCSLCPTRLCRKGRAKTSYVSDVLEHCGAKTPF
jgi:hypothetical protein